MEREKNYKQKLTEHLESRTYRPKTVETLGHWCRVGALSEQKTLEMLELLEEDRRAADSELVGQTSFDWE